ncbi:MAG TPA: sulfite exporter TauE/SafE family protein [Actinomycetota bacterium]|nr:sulfite exporter TauE/SafE family protein [Actinomycetota bacterium]
MIPQLGPGALAWLVLASAAGGAVQGSIGFGFALVVVPALTLIEPEAVPAAVLFLAAPLTVFMAVRERAHIDRRGFLAIAAGRVFGTVGGATLLVAVPTSSISTLLGVMILVAVALSLGGLQVVPTPTVAFGAGLLSVVTGTASAVGGPALAVVYQRRPGPELRATLALSFVVGLTLSLVAVGAVGRLHAWHGVLAIEMLPGLVFGLWSSRHLARALDRGWLRPAVLTFAAAAGLYITVRSVL